MPPRGRPANGVGRPARSFTRDLALADWLTALVGGNYDRLLDTLAGCAPGAGASGYSHFAQAVASRNGCAIAPEVLAADGRIAAHVARIARARPGFTLTYFQWLACLYTDLYLARLKGDRAGLLAALETHRRERFLQLPPYADTELDRIACFMATGAGKTLVLHLNLLQFLEHKPFEPQNVLLITPNESLSAQHRVELEASGLSGLPLEVTEITKFYFADGAARRKSGGVQEPVDHYRGPNLLLVDEGHKGTRGDEERGTGNWRDIRESLAGHPDARQPVEGRPGFTFEYSATFAQVAALAPELHAEYAKSVFVDFGYARFWREGYGKDFRVVNTRDSVQEDVLLTVGLLGFYEQARAFDDAGNRTAILEHNLAAPLAVLVGSRVQGSDDAASEVARVTRFLHRAASDRGWLKDRIASVIKDLKPLQQRLGGDALRFDLLEALTPDQIAKDLQTRLFGGEGALAVTALSDGELGLRCQGAKDDAWCGTIFVGEARKLKTALLRLGLADGGDDRVSGSVFERIERDGRIKFLIGAKRFIEGWSSWRVSSMGLLEVGSGEGSQVIQLFGRGVRLRGRQGALKRAGAAAPAPVRVLETLNVFGLKADYVSAWLTSLERDGIRRDPIWVMLEPSEPTVDKLALQVLRNDETLAEFGREPVVFSAIDCATVEYRIDAEIAVMAGITTPQSLSAAPPTARDLPAAWIDPDRVQTEALAFKERMGWRNLLLPRGEMERFLKNKARIAGPADFFSPRDVTAWRRAEAAVAACIEQALTRSYRAAQREAARGQWRTELLAADDGNFPWTEIKGKRALAYRIELETANRVSTELLKLAQKHVGGLLTEAQFRELEAQVARIVGLNDLAERIEALLQDGKHAMPGDDLSRPLPRLWCEEHLYRPLLLCRPGTEQRGQLSLLDQELGVRLDPPGLEESEARFVWDLRAYWKEHCDEPEWKDCSVYLLRNQAGRGVGFFAEQGFYPDFMLWLKRGTRQALAFIEPKGIELILDDARFVAKLDLLQELRRLSLDVPTRGYLVSATSFDAIAARRPGETRDSLRERGIVIQGEDAKDVQYILGELISLI
jgi:hypothetical protein